MPVEAFEDEASRDAFVEQTRDTTEGPHHGQMIATPLVRWLYEARAYDNYGLTEWTLYLPEIMRIIRKLFALGRWNEIKRGGQGGEMVHDYGLTEGLERSGDHVKVFVCTGNDTYQRILHELDQEIQDAFYEFVKGDRGLSNSARVAEAIGDCFEFAAQWYIGHRRNDLLMQMVTNTMRVQYSDAHVKRVIAWEYREIDRLRMQRAAAPTIGQGRISTGQPWNRDVEDLVTQYLVQEEEEQALVWMIIAEESPNEDGEPTPTDRELGDELRSNEERPAVGPIEPPEPEVPGLSGVETLRRLAILNEAAQQPRIEDSRQLLVQPSQNGTNVLLGPYQDHGQEFRNSYRSSESRGPAVERQLSASRDQAVEQQLRLPEIEPIQITAAGPNLKLFEMLSCIHNTQQVNSQRRERELEQRRELGLRAPPGPPRV